MSEEDDIRLEQTRIFRKAFDRLTEAQQDLVDEEIGKIIQNPKIGEQKRGDLKHLRVHKFTLHNQQVLLGYSWVESTLTIYLLNLGHTKIFIGTQNQDERPI